LKIFAGSILLKTDIYTKRTPPNFSLVKKYLAFTSIEILFNPVSLFEIFIHFRIKTKSGKNYQIWPIDLDGEPACPEVFEGSNQNIGLY